MIKEQVSKNVFIIILFAIDVANVLVADLMGCKGIKLNPVSDILALILLITINVVGYIGHYKRTRYYK